MKIDGIIFKRTGSGADGACGASYLVKEKLTRISFRLPIQYTDACVLDGSITSPGQHVATNVDDRPLRLRADKIMQHGQCQLAAQQHSTVSLIGENNTIDVNISKKLNKKWSNYQAAGVPCLV